MTMKWGGINGFHQLVQEDAVNERRHFFTIDAY